MVVGQRGMGFTQLGVGTLHMLCSSALLMLLLLWLVVRSALDISACQTFSTASLLPLPLPLSLPVPLHLSVCAWVCARWRTTFNPFSGAMHSGAICCNLVRW